ncbi:MAG: prenyltransferase/squalene oxidase repeat-containing protein [Promethearchaeota archaeon]
MKSKSILIIGLFIGLISFSTLIYNSNAQFYFNTDSFELLENPNIVTRRNLILHFLTIDFYDAGMKGFSDGIGGHCELKTTYEGVSAVTALLGQYKGISMPFLLWILGLTPYVKSLYGQIAGSYLPIEFYFGDTVSFINSRWNITSRAYGKDSRSDLDLYSTYYAVKTLELLGKNADSRIVNFVDSLQNDDGGFGSRVNTSSSLRATLYALHLLKKFGRLDLIDNASDWIIQTQNIETSSENFGAFSSNKSDSTYTIYSTYEAIAALLIANGSLNSINRTAAANWIAARQNLNLKTGNLKDYGGFGNPNDISSTMSSSSAAVKALDLLGGLGKIKTFELVIWVIASQKLLYGGFASSPATAVSSVSATYHALSILKQYQWPLLILFTQVPWQLKPELHWSLWLLILLIVFIISIIVLHVIWKRRRE